MPTDNRQQTTSTWSSDQEKQIDLRDYLRVLLKRRWTVITIFAIIVITIAIHTYTTIPVYRATARLVIERGNPKVVSIQEVMAVDASGSDYYQTQYKIIQSRSVAREAIRHLNLEESEEFFPKPKDDFISNLKRSIRDNITYWKDSIKSLLRTEQKTASKKFSIQNAVEEYEPDSPLVSAFIGRVNVTPIRNSRLVDVSFQGKDPVLATKIVNTLAEAYINQNLEIRLSAAQDAVKWLYDRIEEERKKVEKAEMGLIRYKEEHSIVTGFSDNAEIVTAQKFAQISTQVVEAESKRVEAETRYKQASALTGSSGMMDSISEVLNNPLIAEIKTIEVDLYKRMSELSKKYGRKHPQMLAIESELKTIQKRKKEEISRIINSLGNEYRLALAREKSLKAALANQKKEILELNQKAIQYGVLQREAESAKQMYELLVNRFKETSLTEDMRTGNIRIIDRAEVPRAPILPQKRRNILMAIIVGLMAGIGLAFFFEYLDNTIKIPEDVKKHLNIPYLGPAPLFQTENKRTRGGDRSSELVTFHSPKSTSSESYRGIRTSILFSSAESPPQAILITSAGPREGKTITTANLAITMAQSGSRVIILDCDMRRPKLHKIFSVSRDQGVSNLLVGSGDFQEFIVHTQMPNLDFIPCGPIPPNPSEILGSTRMVNLLNELRKQYAHILIDSPPSTAVTDAVVLSKSVDGVVLVIRANDTAREIVKNGVAQLESVGAHILGAVLNGIDLGSDKYYYYYYYQYYYYYSEDGEKKRKKLRKKKRKKRSESYYSEEA